MKFEARIEELQEDLKSTREELKNAREMITCLNKTVKVVSKVEIPDRETELERKLELISEKLDKQDELEKKVDALTEHVMQISEEKNTSQEMNLFRDALGKVEERFNGISTEFETMNKKIEALNDGFYRKIEEVKWMEVGKFDEILNEIKETKANSHGISSDPKNNFKVVAKLVEEFNDLQKKIGSIEGEMSSQFEKLQRHSKREMENNDEILVEIGKIKRRMCELEGFLKSDAEKVNVVKQVNNKIEDDKAILPLSPDKNLEFGEFKETLFVLLKNIEERAGRIAYIEDDRWKFNCGGCYKPLNTKQSDLNYNSARCSFCKCYNVLEKPLKINKWMKISHGEGPEDAPHYQQFPKKTKNGEKHKCDICGVEGTVSTDPNVYQARSYVTKLQ